MFGNLSMTKVNSFWQPVKKQKLKPAPLFGFNLKPQKVKSISPVNLKIYPARIKREMRLIDKNPFGDKDRDKVPNFWDCKPLNRKKQGFLVRVTKKGVKERYKPQVQNVIKTSGYSFELTKKEFKKRYPEESKLGLFSDKRAKTSIWKRGLHVDDDNEDELELKRKTKERYFRGIANKDEEKDEKREKSKVTPKTIEEINKWRKSREEPIIKKIRIRQTKEEKEDAAKLAAWYKETYGPEGKFRKGEEQLMKSYEKSDEKGDEDNIRMEDIQFEDENLEEEVDSSKIKSPLKLPVPEKIKEEQKPISEEQQKKRDYIQSLLGRKKWGKMGVILPRDKKEKHKLISNLAKLKDIKETPRKIQSIIPGEFEQELYYKIPQIPLIKVQEEDRRLTESKVKSDKIISDKEKEYEEQLLKGKEDYEGSAQQLLDLSDSDTAKEFKEAAVYKASEPKEKAERREPTAQELIDESI